MIRRLIGKKDGIRFLKWTITKTEKNPPTYGWAVQASEFVIFDENGDRILYPVSAKSTCPNYVSHPNESFQGPDKLIDNKTFTPDGDRFYNPSELPVTVIIDISKHVSISKYGYYTADDDWGRDPVSWTLEASSDGVHYDMIDLRNDISKVSTRNALVGPFSINI